MPDFRSGHVGRVPIAPIPLDDFEEVIVRARTDNAGLPGLRWSKQTDNDDRRNFDLEVALASDGSRGRDPLQASSAEIGHVSSVSWGHATPATMPV